MKVLSELVRNLAIILILASLLEMFLPSKSMSRYVQTIVGLFILVTILSPILSLINQDWGDGLEAWTGTSQGPTIEEILADGTRLGEAEKNQAARQYQEKLAAQVKGVASLVPGVRVQGAAVKMKEKEGVVAGLESITLRVVLKQDSQQDTASDSEAVTAITATGDSAATDRINKLRETLANLYGLQPEVVEIEEVKEMPSKGGERSGR